jgi:hypothetical protein
VLKPSSGKENLARCTQISCPMQSRFMWLYACRRLREDNKEREELVDVAPHWGESRISYVVVALCIIVVMLLM